MKRSTFWFMLVAGTLAVGTGYSLWNFAGNRNSPVFPGIIEADDIQVGSKVAGRVLKVVAREGQTVKEGETLLLLEPGELDAALADAQAAFRQAESKFALVAAGSGEEEIEQAEAALKKAQLELDQLVSTPQQEEIANAASEWMAAKWQLDKFRNAAKRTEELFKRDLIAGQEHRSALSAAEEAEQRLKAAGERYDALIGGAHKEKVEAARYRISEAESKLRQLRRGYRQQETAHAKSELERARARVQWIRAQLDETVIRAPADALVERLDLQPGDLIAPGKPVVTLLRTGSLWVRAYISQAKSTQLRPGLPVKVRVGAAGNKDFSGVVRRIHRQSEFNPLKSETDQGNILQVFQTEVMIDDPEQQLRPGMNADVIIPKT